VPINPKQPTNQGEIVKRGKGEKNERGEIEPEREWGKGAKRR